MAESTNTEETRNIAQSLMDKFAAKDAEGVVSLWKEGGIETNSLADAAMEVPREFQPFLEQMFTALDNFTIEIDNIIADNNMAAIKYKMVGDFVNGSLQGLEANGKRLTFKAVDVIRVEDSKIVANDVYIDGIQIARQLGVFPPTGSIAERAVFALMNGRTKLSGLFSGK